MRRSRSLLLPAPSFAAPQHAPLPPVAALAALASLVAKSQRLLLVTGAGISTDSGIPDYRSPNRPAYRPLQHHEFVASERVRRRYWARSFVGFRTMRDARPNAAHAALAALERLGRARAGLITQNVDRLHHRAENSPETRFDARTLAERDIPVQDRFRATSRPR